MGTRNLTAVMLDGKYKIAQYGQWDGYPSGQGITCLEFLRECNLDDFKSKVAGTKIMTRDEINSLGSNWEATHPQLSRNHGAGILQLVNDGAKELSGSISFAGDSLFCEYAYVVDLDKKTFEVFQGFNNEKLSGARFNSDDQSLDSSGEYEPVKIIKTYSLDSLPTNDEFLSELEPEED